MKLSLSEWAWIALIALVALLLGGFSGLVLGNSSQTFIVRVEEETTPNFHGLRYFNLIAAKDGTRISVLGDADLDLIKALAQHEGQRVRIVMEKYEAKTLER